MLVLVAGLPGSGKTYFAKRLAERMRAEHLSSDVIRRQIGAQRNYTPGQKMAVYEELRRKAESALQQRRHVVVDATFYLAATRSMFYELTPASQLKPCVIEIFAEDAVVRDRLLRPRSDSDADYAVYRYIKGRFEPIENPHLRLDSSDNDAERMIEEALRFIYSCDGQRPD